LLDWAKQNNR